MLGNEAGKLPLPPMLMVDRILEIFDSDGKYNKGKILAELDINDDLWFFKCHFKEDPVMPGCLGLDGLWQLVGFYLTWKGGIGKKEELLGWGMLSSKGKLDRITKK